MSITATLFGQTRLVPEEGEEGWGGEVTDQLVDLLAAANAGFTRDASDNVVPRRESAASTVTAGATLTVTAARHILTAASALSLSAATALEDGLDGQEVDLEGTSDTNLITVLDGANTDLRGLCELGAGEVLRLIWNDTDSVWREQGRSN